MSITRTKQRNKDLLFQAINQMLQDAGDLAAEVDSNLVETRLKSTELRELIAKTKELLRANRHLL